jgi:copper ion binding protein
MGSGDRSPARTASKETVVTQTPTTHTAQYTVAGMTCGHCVAAVTEEVAKIEGVTAVDVDLTTGAVTVQSIEPIDASAVAEAVDEAGYSVVP